MKRNPEQALSRHLDGELPKREAEKLQATLAASPELGRQQAAFEQIGDLLRAQDVPAGKPAEVAWSDVQRALRQEHPDADAGAAILSSRLRWAAATMSAVFVALGLVVVWNGRPAMATAPAEVEWVSTDVPGAGTMVYQDQETGLTVIWMMEDESNEQGNVDT